MNEQTNKRITMKQLNGKRITTIQTPKSYLCICKPVKKKMKQNLNLFEELGIETVY